MKLPPRRERSSMNTGTSTSFAEQEAAAMEKNRESFMALWNEYVKGRKGDKAVLRYLEEAGFFTSPASTKHHGAFPGGLCYHSVNVAAEVLGLLAQHQLEDENMNASAVTCALLHDICKVGTYRQTTKRQRGQDGKWQDAPAYEYDDSGLPLGHGEKSLFLLQRLGMELTDQEAAAIRWHMGAYRDHDCYNEMGRAFERYALALFLHLADMTASSTAPGYIGTADPADEVMATLSGLSIEQLEEYRDGGWLYGLKVRNPRRLPEPVPLEALHLDYPPQSWRWLDSINADGLAEIAAAQGVKL